METSTRKVDALSATIDRSCIIGKSMRRFRYYYHTSYFSVSDWNTPKNKLSGRCTLIPNLTLTNFGYPTNNLIYAWWNPTLQRGEGRERWNEPTFPILLSMFAVLKQRYATIVEQKLETDQENKTVDKTPKYRIRQNGKLMIRSIIRTSRHTEFGIRAKFVSLSAIRGAFHMRESA